MLKEDFYVKCDNLASMIKESKKAVFFGGAGVSTESGIPDFRSRDGLYNQKYKYPPEQILGSTFFHRNPSEFYRFYRDKLDINGVLPNVTHKFLCELEKRGKLIGVITQNIDGLHQAAGSRAVMELHGSLLRNYCIRCKKKYGIEAVRNSEDVPKCTCGGIIRPDIVLYEEGLDDEIVENSLEMITGADLMIIAGTSLNVYPAAGLIRYFRGKYTVLINRDPTPYDSYADLVINENMGEVFSYLWDKIF